MKCFLTSLDMQKKKIRYFSINMNKVYFSKNYKKYQKAKFINEEETVDTKKSEKETIAKQKFGLKLSLDRFLMIKPIYNKNKVSSPLNILAKFNDFQIKSYYDDLKQATLNLENTGPKFMPLWYTVHTIPLLLFFGNTSQIVWVYQIFWIGAATGLNYSAYEFYSTVEEYRLNNRHNMLAYIFINL